MTERDALRSTRVLREWADSSRVTCGPPCPSRSWIRNLCCGHQASRQQVTPPLSPDSWPQHHVADPQYISWSTQGTPASAWRLVSRAPHPAPHGSASHPHPRSSLKTRRRTGKLRQLTVFSFIYFFNRFFVFLFFFPPSLPV